MLAALLCLGTAPLTAQVPTPETHFGFRMGADRQLADADAIEAYFESVAKLSDRVELIDIGATTDGHRTLAAIVSAPKNIRNLERIRDINQRLADPRTLPRDDAERLMRDHKAVIAIGASIHATEIGATQASNELLYTLATATDQATLTVLDETVVILIPMLNPDGHRLVVDWYRRTRGTPFEGGPMPWLYHRYAGHDINRDAFMMNLAESRNLSRFFYGRWHPQIFLTMHQMPGNGPRFFVPPNSDPIDPNYDPLIWREAALLGSGMALELQHAGRSGVLSNGLYDYYWPGYEDSAPLGHNTVCLLTEVAEVKIATPVTIAPSDLRLGPQGLPYAVPQVNFPDPWPGGTWSLRHIVDYDLTAAQGLLSTAAAHRAAIVENFYRMGQRAVEAGRTGGPFAFVVPPDQHDPSAAAKLESLLLDGAIEIQRALEPFRADGDVYPAGTDIILLTQPYRAYVKTLLERQDYPGRLNPSATGDRPYDVTGWTLPAQMGVSVRTIERAFEPPAMTQLAASSLTRPTPGAVWGSAKPRYYLIEGRGTGGARAANRLVAAGLTPGWTRAAIDANGYSYQPGSMVIPYSKRAGEVVRTIAADLGLRVDGMQDKPPAVSPIGRARVAVYKPWVENIDEGWTRWVLDAYEFRYTTITDADVRAGRLHDRFDVLIVPSAPAARLIGGHARSAVPPEFAGGLGGDGVEAIKRFVDAGGRLICLDQATSLGTEIFHLPLRDATRDAGDRFFCPGSLVRLDVDTSSPLGYGMLPKTAAFFAFSAAFEDIASDDGSQPQAQPGERAPVETAAHYGTRDVLVSGWLDGEDVIAGRSAVLRARIGRGDVVLFGFPVQHRGQSLTTFRLLFNAILDSQAVEPTAKPAGRR